MHECEARYWMKQIAKRGKRGRAWWNDRKDGIRKKRGEAALQELVDEMNKQQNEKREAT